MEIYFIPLVIIIVVALTVFVVQAIDMQIYLYKLRKKHKAKTKEIYTQLREMADKSELKVRPEPEFSKAFLNGEYESPLSGVSWYRNISGKEREADMEYLKGEVIKMVQKEVRKAFSK